MSNLETAPPEVACVNEPGHRVPPGPAPTGELITPRAVPLGGPRAMPVRRTLPQRARSLIGAWCFADHYGPDDVSATGGMRVPGHPHTGLQTVSWLFRGEVEHRDTTGAHALVRPGELNVMTAGRGIAHSEFSTPDTSVLHGAQLWLALPDAHRFRAPAFEHYVPPSRVDGDGVRVLLFLGSLAGESSPVRTFSPLLGAEVTVPAGRAVEFPVERGFEHGVLVDTGRVTVAGVVAGPGELVYQPLGADRITLRAEEGAEAARVLLLGGAPLEERIVMWWNFVGRDHEEIATYREWWQSQRAGQGEAEEAGGERRFGPFPEAWGRTGTLPAPELPNARLRPRG
ncbi:pirin family protein [Streptomyces sp. 4N509B]|uniref:pirin family protein n=1 Tax=Streptomyces sp. 4N509B TaxID=3457413 RepID=UPI003FD6988C